MAQLMPSQVGAPTAEDLAHGVKETLKRMMADAVHIAETAPALADRMKQVRQLAMESVMVTQNMVDQDESGSGGY